MLAVGVSAWAVACQDEPDEPCRANVDCPGLGACVLGECVTDPEDCERIGAMVDVTEIRPFFAAKVKELHVHLAADGAVHYCYYGEDASGSVIAYYGRQTAWNNTVEVPLATSGGSPARCGAIATTPDGGVAVLSRSPGAVLFGNASGGFGGPTLDGLQGIEAQGALAGDRTSISLRADAQGGVLVGLSLGYQIESQPIYLARATAEGLEVLVNGWKESGTATWIGHAPQLWDPGWGGAAAVMGRVLAFRVVLVDQDMSGIDTVEGVHPRLAVSGSGTARVAYLDRNWGLWIDEIQDGAFQERAFVGEIGLDESNDAQLPWDLVIDDEGRDHLLYEDATQGLGALVYRVIEASGEVGEPAMLTVGLAGDLPGGQLYSQAPDICGRVTVATVEDDGAGGVPVIRVREGR
jgi:hypothetical protein